MANSQSEKVFIGRTTVIKTQYGEITKISFGPQDYEKLEQYKNASGWINLEVKEKRGGERYCEVSLYQGKGGAQQSAPVGAAVNQEDDDMPF